MDATEKIRRLLAEAQDLEFKADDAYWRAKSEEYGYTQDWFWEKEAGFRYQAKARRDEAEALMKAQPDSKLDGASSRP